MAELIPLVSKSTNTNEKDREARRLAGLIGHCFSELFEWPEALYPDDERQDYPSAALARRGAKMRRTRRKEWEQATAPAQARATLAPPQAQAVEVSSETEDIARGDTGNNAEAVGASLAASVPSTSPGSSHEPGQARPLVVISKLPPLRANPHTMPSTVWKWRPTSVYYQFHPNFITPLELIPAIEELDYDEKLVLVYRLGLHYEWREIGQLLHRKSWQSVAKLFKAAMQKLVEALAEHDEVLKPLEAAEMDAEAAEVEERLN